MDHLKRRLWLPFVTIWCLLSSGFTGEAGTVVINEIHYNPDIKTELVGFIELFNTAATPVNLSGWTISSAVDYTFPSGTTIPAGGFVVVSENTNAFRVKFGFTPLGPWAGNLNSTRPPARRR